MSNEIHKLEQACGAIFYLMNAVDHARAQVRPSDHDYYGKRKALLTAIATLIAERDAAVADAAAFRALKNLAVDPGFRLSCNGGGLAALLLALGDKQCEVPPERWHAIIRTMGRFCMNDISFPTREEAMSQPCAVDAWKEPGEQA